jgi:hypothetical protein
MRHLLFAAIALLAACGAPDEDFDDLELGTAEQAFSSKTFYGVREDVAAPSEGGACESPTTGTSTQKCGYPFDKVVTFSCGTGFTASELTLCQQLVDAEVLSLAAQFGGSGWQFSRVAQAGEIIFHEGALGGTSTTSIRPYVNWGPSGTVAAPEAADYRGTHRRVTNAAVTVDWAKVDANFTAASGNQLRVKAHTIQNGTSWAVGLGYNGSTTDRKNSSAITAGTAKQSNYTTADRCRVNGYDPGGSATITISGGC